jgi:hypothetical protein
MFPADSIFVLYPYLLPSIVCSSLALLAIIAIYLFVPETLSRLCLNDDKQAKDLMSQTVSDDENLSDDGYIELLAKPRDEVNATDGSTTRSVKSASYSSPGSYLTMKSLCHDRNFLLLCVLFFVQYFIMTFIDESIPLWAVTSVEKAGLSLSSWETGVMLAIVGVGLIIFQLFLYEAIVSALNCAENIAISCLSMVAAVGLVLIPLSSDLSAYLLLLFQGLGNFKRLLILILAIVSQLVYSCFGTSIYTNLSVIVNSSTTKQMRGTINGLMMTLGSLGNALGPIVGSYVYALLVDAANPVDGRWIFWIAAILMLGYGLLCRYFLCV